MNEEVPGKNIGIASLVLGIISVVCCFSGPGAIAAVILGIVGLVLASRSLNQGYDETIRAAGFILSLIGVILGAIVFLVSLVLLALGVSLLFSILA